MQGQMHVHAPDLSTPVTVLAHFFLRILTDFFSGVPDSVTERVRSEAFWWQTAAPRGAGAPRRTRSTHA
ncbi:hypothetical protein SSAG_05401 [Streptomyces sp. Mg1]|nr:hypothetical protein SSAG_05401 [Streptomyces sp. Mg1]